MPNWLKSRIPTNLITGFLGSGKTTAIANLLKHRPSGEKWSVFVNEYGTVSIDQVLVDTDSADIAVQELGGGCVCCTMAMAFQPLLAQFIRRSKPNRLIVEPSGASHPAKIVDILRSPNFAGSIDLRNTICLIDPQDFADSRWRDTAVFQDQVQLADIVVLNWTDQRDRESVDRCREWVNQFRPAKQLIVETSFGVIEPELLDLEFTPSRHPMFADAHSAIAGLSKAAPQQVEGPTDPIYPPGHPRTHIDDAQASIDQTEPLQQKPQPNRPIRSQNTGLGFDACGWIFHVDDIFDRDRLLDLLGHVHPILRLKGVFRCRDDWWMINRVKDTTEFVSSAYRRDSRLEVILDQKTSGWDEFEEKLLLCLDGNSNHAPDS